MGIYVNPPDMTKEEWLRVNATEHASAGEAQAASDTENLMVVLVDNGPFTAAQRMREALGDFSEEERRAT